MVFGIFDVHVMAWNEVYNVRFNGVLQHMLAFGDITIPMFPTECAGKRGFDLYVAGDRAE